MNKPQTDRVGLNFKLGNRTLFRASWQVLRHDLSAEEVLAGASPHEMYLYSLPARLDGIVTRQLPSKGRRTLSQTGGYLAYVVERRRWNCVVLKGSFEHYLTDRFSAKSMESLCRDEARFLTPSGALDLREYRSTDELCTFSGVLPQFAQTAGLPGLEKEDIRAYALFANDQPAAFLVTQGRGDTLLCLGVGEKEAFRPNSAEAVLHLAVIRRLFEEGSYRFLELPPGDGDHKNRYATTAVRCCDVLWLRRTLVNQALIRTHRFLQRLSGWLDRQGSLAGASDSLQGFAAASGR